MKTKPLVVVGLSGGVDSSVAAARLKKQGCDVIGIYLKNWSQPINQAGECPWIEDVAYARRVAEKLAIPFYVLNFEKDYKKQVVDYFFREYRAGRTPNPDVMCNKFIKFDLFLKAAKQLGADYIATGHYARVASNDKVQMPNIKLLKGVDPKKDQSYFLWTLEQDQLRSILMPIGNYTKTQVRVLAGKFNLPTAERKDSQGICFIGPINVGEFIRTRIKPKAGRVITTDGKTIGRHDGVWFYTIGQREGLKNLDPKALDVKELPPLYIINKDVKTNTLVVGPGDTPGLYHKKLHATDLNWVAGSPPAGKFKAAAKIRYGQNDQPCLVKISDDQAEVTFDQAQRAITPGQSIVFYRDDELLGGGIIS